MLQNYHYELKKELDKYDIVFNKGISEGEVYENYLIFFEKFYNNNSRKDIDKAWREMKDEKGEEWKRTEDFLNRLRPVLPLTLTKIQTIAVIAVIFLPILLSAIFA